MSDVRLIARASRVTLDLSALAPHRFADMSEREIAAIDVRADHDTVPLGEVMHVHGGHSASVHIETGEVQPHGIGAGLAGGDVIVDGNAGCRIGAGMTGGRLHVLGSVGDEAGLFMRGGELRVDGDAGDRLGAAAPGTSRGLSGGEIVVRGNAGREAGARARRGLIVIGGQAGSDLARDIIAGTLVVFGTVGARPGVGSKRGSLVAIGGIDVPPTYRLACTFEPAFVRLLMTYLARRFALNVAPDVVAGTFRRYCGDAGLPGKGEILEWVAP